MKIAVLCATARGLRALEAVRSAAPEAEILVMTFLETPHEPRYVENIKNFCLTHDCQFGIQTKLSEPPAAEWFGAGFDMLLCFSWRYMVPASIYRSARLGSYVIHDSLLPKYRGFSPTLWALINGEKEVGITFFEMGEVVDSGGIVAQFPIPVMPDDDVGTLRDKGTEAVVLLLQEHLPILLTGKATLTPQDESLATYTCKWLPSDSKIDWSQPRERIHNLVRASTEPYPGAYTNLGSDKITVWRTRLETNTRNYASRLPGAVSRVNADGTVGVLTGNGELVLVEVSLNDGPRVPAQQLLRPLSTRLG